MIGPAHLFSTSNFFQPPTPSTTPGPGSVPQQHQNFLGIIPELLQESIDNLQGTDEGLASTSSPATPIQTPHSPTLSHQSEGGRNHQVVLPEQLAAGITKAQCGGNFRILLSLILREINFGDSTSAKSAIYTHLEVLHFAF